MNGKPSSPVLRGLGASDGARLLDQVLFGADGVGGPCLYSPLLRENETPGCPIQRVLENDFVVVTGTGTARDFIRLLTDELH